MPPRLWSSLLALVLAFACDGTRGTPRASPDGASNQCENGLVSLYGMPGCGANAPQPLCMHDYACLGYACSCEGKVIEGCLGFREPYAYKSPSGSSPRCDPNSSGTGGFVGTGGSSSGGNGSAGAQP